MFRGIIAAFAVSFLLLSIKYRCYSQDPGERPVRLMFYNVENLFDITDDSLREDNDFLPDGAMKWSSYRYNRKISSVYKTIVAAGSWSPPDIISFCEVEIGRAHV